MRQFVLPCPSPCVRKCGIDESRRCSGCFRTGREVADWYRLEDEEKWNLFFELIERKESDRIGLEGKSD